MNTMLDEEPIKAKDKANNKLIHYYGDMVRTLYLIAGVIMLVTLPLFKTVVPIDLAIIAIVVTALLAGLISFRHGWVFALNIAASLVGISIFEYYAVLFQGNESVSSFFWINQILAIIFFFAAYFGVKTIRWMYMEKE